MNEREIRQGLQTAMEDVRVSPKLRAKTLRAMRGTEDGRGENARAGIKRKGSLVPAVTLVCVMLAAVALAVVNRAGVLDFMGNSPNSVLPDNAADYVQPMNTTAKDEGLVAGVREAFYDGRTLRMIVDIAMENQKAVLLGLDYTPADRWQSLTHSAGQEEDETDTRSILDVYHQGGYEAIYDILAYTKEEQEGTAGGSYDIVLGEDGVLTCYIEQTYDTDQPERAVEMNIRATRYREENGEMRQEDEPCATLKLSFSVGSSAKEDASGERWVSAEPIEYEEVGVRIDRVTMTVKPLEIYYTIDYTVTDMEKFAALDGGLNFEWMDLNSAASEYWKQRLKEGPSGSSGVRPTDGGDLETAATWRQEGTFALSEWKQEYTLRAYDCWKKTRYDTHTIEMLPEE